MELVLGTSSNAVYVIYKYINKKMASDESGSDTVGNNTDQNSNDTSQGERNTASGILNCIKNV